MSNIFEIKRDDILPPIQATLMDGSGNIVDLTTATSVKFLMRHKYTHSVKVSAAGLFVSPRTGGKVQYAWVSADTDTAGDYECEFEVTTSGAKQTYPASGYLYVIVWEDIPVELA